MFDRWTGKEHRRNYRAGIIAAAIYNVNRDRKKTPEPIDPMLFFTSPKEPTVEEIASSLDYALRMADAGFKGD